MDEQRRRLYDPAWCPNGVRLHLGNVYLAEILLHSYLDSDLESLPFSLRPFCQKRRKPVAQKAKNSSNKSGRHRAVAILWTARAKSASVIDPSLPEHTCS
jgi:hypothetical protein